MPECCIFLLLPIFALAQPIAVLYATYKILSKNENVQHLASVFYRMSLLIGIGERMLDDFQKYVNMPTAVMGISTA